MAKKGAWTDEEDTVLVKYVKRHGEGRWHMIERRTELKRGGKSCRLRWFNHLRSQLKRGPFSPEEERIVIELHAQMGNRWAHMAKKLPGRSDNEIKNFWNARVKRLERSKLPIYPEGIVPRYNKNNRRNQNHTASVSNERSFPSLLRSHPNPRNSQFNLPPQLSMGPFNYSGPINRNLVIPNSSFSNHNYIPINRNGGYYSLGSNSYLPPFSSTLSSSTSTMHYPNSPTHFSSADPFQSQSNNFNPNPIPSLSMLNYSDPQQFLAEGGLTSIQSVLGLPLASGESSIGANLTNMSELYNQYGFLPNSSDPQQFFANSERELSSIQSIQSILGPLSAACESSNGANLMNMSELGNQYCFTPIYTDDGSLEDIFRAPKTSDPNDVPSRKGKEICMWDSDCCSSSTNMTTGMLNGYIGEMLPFNDDLSALVKKFSLEAPNTDGKHCDSSKEMVPFDDDLLALVENFPMENASTDWYQALFKNSSNKN